MNKLDQADLALFFDTFRILMDYANRHFHIDDKIDFLHDALPDCELCKKASDKIWEDPALIDDILCTANLSDEQRKLLSDWKNHICGTFIIERHLKDGSIFLDDNKAYQVVGLTDSIQEVFSQYPLPIMVKTTLLPFHGVIVADGLFAIFPISFGPGTRAVFKSTYMSAKQNGRIIRQLSTDDRNVLPPCMQETEARNHVPARKNEKPVNLYRLKVYPNGNGRSVYRVIEICGNATLEELCSTILAAFDFTDEHLYEFLIGSYSRFQSHPEDGEDSVNISLDSLHLIPKQKFFLHYDFGDDWMFTITVNGISEASPIGPHVVKSLGSIEQYPEEW